jgi:hypothetical protein
VSGCHLIKRDAAYAIMQVLAMDAPGPSYHPARATGKLVFDKILRLDLHRLQARECQAADFREIDLSQEVVQRVEDMRIGALHVRDKRANNRVENSHQPTRERERRRRRFKSAKEAQRIFSTYSTICYQFRQSRHLVSATTHRELMGRRFAEWRDVCAAAV